MNFRGHFKLTLKKIPHGGLFETLDMLLLDISGLYVKNTAVHNFLGQNGPHLGYWDS